VCCLISLSQCLRKFSQVCFDTPAFVCTQQFDAVLPGLMLPLQRHFICFSCNHRLVGSSDYVGVSRKLNLKCYHAFLNLQILLLALDPSHQNDQAQEVRVLVSWTVLTFSAFLGHQRNITNISVCNIAHGVHHFCLS
jgi:hypothetical protein